MKKRTAKYLSAASLWVGGILCLSLGAWVPACGLFSLSTLFVL